VSRVASRFLRFPTVFYVEPTNDCNLSCVMCARKKSKKAVGYMSLELYRHVVGQLASRGLGVVTLHQAGEPLLHPHIAHMVAYAKERGLRRVRFATNGTLLTGDLARNLVEAGLDSITVSMDATTGARYCPALADHELLANLDENVQRLIALRDRRGLDTPEVHMQIVNMPATQDLVTGFRQRWTGVADRVTVKPLLSWAGHVKTSRKRSARRLICANHLYQGVVQWDGEVSFCCIYIDSSGDASGILGNAVHNSLEDIFLGERRQAILEAQLRGNYEVVPYCLRCPDWSDYLGWVRAREESAAGVEV
jgi:hypothetical protein